MLTSSVIICTRNRRDDLIICLQSIAIQTVSPTQLIIVDSSDIPVTADASITLICQQIQRNNTQLIMLHTAPGLPFQRNRGIAQAQADIVYFFDDDVQLEPTYIGLMNAMFEQYPDFVGGMGRVKNIGVPPTAKYRLFRTLFLLSRDYASGHFTWSGMPTHVFGAHHWQSVEVLSGCCMAYRKHVFTKHLFDERLGGYAYMEDCDFSARVSYDGPLFFNPDARLFHFHSPASRDAVIKNKAMLIHNYSYLFFKNFYPKNRLKVMAYAWSILGLFLEALIIRRRDYLRGYVKGLRQFFFKNFVPS
jgi:GT2 family glycosyltransferase